MFTIQGIDHVVLRVKDLEAMLRFYRDGLGCVLERAEEKIGLYQLRAGAALIDLVPVDGPLGKQGGPAPGEGGHNMDHLCLAVTPFAPDEIAARLKAYARDIGKVARRYGAQGHGPSLYVTDPEGNIVELKGPPETT
ncbi:MAG: VOC family protein [Alphaproteobacteria bacterium]|nr:MAG: VOC family protein [Alphaproteobacteria bacterium]